MKNAVKVDRDSVESGDSTIEYSISRSRRRKKTIEIKVNPGGSILVSAPVRTSREEIRQVILKRSNWIIRKVNEPDLRPSRKELVSGESILYLGNEAQLLVEGKRTRWVRILFDQSGFRIAVPVHLDGEARRTAIEAAIVKWYKGRAAEHFGQRADRWATLYGHNPTRILIRSPRRYWGSCSSDGTIRFNWRLILAPPALIDYIVVHELAHLRVKNHSAAFWSEVARLMPDYELRRSLLKELGPKLVL